jgi:predicted RNA-binding protein YlxR (DUF448 family)
MERVVRTTDGQAVPDPSGRMPGRGTYVCTDPACQASLGRDRAIARALGLTGAANATT